MFQTLFNTLRYAVRIIRKSNNLEVKNMAKQHGYLKQEASQFISYFSNNYKQQSSAQPIQINFDKIKSLSQNEQRSKQTFSSTLNSSFQLQQQAIQKKNSWSIVGELKKKKLQTHKQLRSINPSDVPVAYGFFFPLAWSNDTIHRVMDPRKKDIVQVKHALNCLGQTTGKVSIFFKDFQTMKKYVLKFNEQFLILKEEMYRVVLKPFQLRQKQIALVRNSKRMKNCVKITNLDFGITREEIQRMASDFGTVLDVDMLVRPNGDNHGIAKVFMSRREEALNFSFFIQGFVYEDRILKGQLIETQPIKRKVKSLNSMKEFKKKMPTIIINGAVQIMKRNMQNNVRKQ